MQISGIQMCSSSNSRASDPLFVFRFCANEKGSGWGGGGGLARTVRKVNLVHCLVPLYLQEYATADLVASQVEKFKSMAGPRNDMMRRLSKEKGILCEVVISSRRRRSDIRER